MIFLVFVVAVELVFVSALILLCRVFASGAIVYAGFACVLNVPAADVPGMFTENAWLVLAVTAVTNCKGKNVR
jgi:hypothetical protein